MVDAVRCFYASGGRFAASMLAALLLLLPAALVGAQPPPNFADTPVASGWNQAVGITFAPDGRMFVWEKGGRVWNVENGVKAAQPLIDLSEEVGDWRDFGLLGFAIDPDFYSNGYIYLLYVVDYHHLIYHGTPNYNPAANWYFRDTIGRLTRYTCNATDGYRSVDYGSRLVLIGESITTGFPICHQSHGIGSLVFGEDGTLLASCGDGASYETVDTGGPQSGSSNTALADGIITPKEDVGAYRSQLVDSLSGKVVRIDPATGDGIPSNPFYDSAAPRAPRSRVWALGLRNPFRMTLRPGTGSTDPAAADPGTLYIGDVGWNVWEDLNVCTGPGQNFDWPAFEGFLQHSGYWNANVSNLDAPNPLYGTTPPGQGPCNQQYFYFRNLIIQDTLNPDPAFPNPCDPSQNVPASIPHFIHRRPAIDWGHGSGPARTGIYVGNDAGVINVGAPGSPVAGPQFGGNCSVGGTWYTGAAFPAEYQNIYFHADFSNRWIRGVVFDAQDRPVEVRNFYPEGAGAIVAIAFDSVGDRLCYINYDQSGVSAVRAIQYVDQLPPQAVASASPQFGPAPLAVQFSSAGSYDPEGQPLQFEWNFGDGSPPAFTPNPIHIFPTQDVSATGTIIAKVLTLDPPHPTGGGNWDPEVIRDNDYPPVGNTDSSRQYDTYHGGDQGNEDWIGYQFTLQRKFTGLIFQEGKHFFDGGWFDNLRVQVRTAGVWNDVTGLEIDPPYAGNNGVNYETYVIRFNPVIGTRIRLYGEPGGSANFISVGELRALAEPTNPPSGPTPYTVTLKVTDAFNAFATDSIIVSINNTPPAVQITSPPDGYTYPLHKPVVLPLEADIQDAEHGPGQLTCAWQTILHHDDHTHPEPIDQNCSTETVLTPHGSFGSTFFYEITLTVTDAAGLSASDALTVYPDCFLLVGDFDLNCVVDDADFGQFRACFTGDGGGPIGPECAMGDADVDLDVDCADWQAFEASYAQSQGDRPLLDVPTFVAVLLGTDAAAADRCIADLNDDGAHDGQDVQLYVAAAVGT